MGKLMRELASCSSTNSINCNGCPNHTCSIFNYKPKEKSVYIQNHRLISLSQRLISLISFDGWERMGYIAQGFWCDHTNLGVRICVWERKILVLWILWLGWPTNPWMICTCLSYPPILLIWMYIEPFALIRCTTLNI